MTTKPSEISALVSIITNAANTIESYYKTSETKPYVPSLDEIEPHPLDHTAYPPDVRHAVQTLEGACNQLSTTIARPGHTMLNVRRSSLLDDPAYKPVISVPLRNLCVYV